MIGIIVWVSIVKAVWQTSIKYNSRYNKMDRNAIKLNYIAPE